jgi:hypothetical protein
MKLNSAQLERTLGQFEAQAIPDDHPVIPQLNDLFGEHTFLLDSHGLNIVEPVEAEERQTQRAVRQRPRNRARSTPGARRPNRARSNRASLPCCNHPRERRLPP